MRLNWAWVQRRWWEFRIADAQYGRYLTGFTSFITLVYSLLIVKYGFLQAVFTSILMFAIIFLSSYIPIFSLIGHFFHRKRQLAVEQEIAVRANPFLWKTQPGRDQLLSLPSSILIFTWHLRMFKRQNLVTPEEDAAALKYLQMMTDLVAGKSLKKYARD